MRHVEGYIRRSRHHVEVVSAHATQQLGITQFNFLGIAHGDIADFAHQIAITLRAIELRQVARRRAKVILIAIGQHRIHAAHVMHHIAVENRA